MEFVLVIFIHAGVLSKGDSMAVGVVPGFSTQAECTAAGNAANGLVGGTVKDARFVCLQRKKA
jgi:hypothetical protein